MTTESRAIESGAARLAHAVRRSTALYVAMSISPEGTTEETLFATADRMAGWIRGGAAEQPDGTPGEFLGTNPWE